MNWEIVIGISSSIIALCALATSIWQAWVTRVHNKISHRPHLTTWTNQRSEKGLYMVRVLNNGLGPALIGSFDIRVDGKKIEGKRTEAIDNALKIIFPDHRYVSQYGHMGAEYVMSAKEKCDIVLIQFNSQNLPSSELVMNALDRADLEISYSSFYGEKFVLSTKE